MRKKIVEFVNRLLPKNWDSWSLEQRREFWLNKNIIGECERTRVCAHEIWYELFCHDRAPTLNEIKNINDFLKRIPYYKTRSSVYCGPIYGRQRGFVKDAIIVQISKMTKERLNKNESN